MDEARRWRKIKKSKIQEHRKQTIIASGKRFIDVFRKLLQGTSTTTEEKFLYMQRVFHAIFFYGHINCPQIQPKDFIPAISWPVLQKKFPKPLREYSTHLPCQTPYSTLLEYMTKVYGKQEVLELLMKINRDLLINICDDEGKQLSTKDFALSASVITQSYIFNSSENHAEMFFGSSIAYKGEVARNVMIAISALFVWDKVISYEVSCAEGGQGIHFPNNVYCNSYRFDIQSLEFEAIPPCIKCHQMFIVKFDPTYVETNKREEWRHGNCAETESLSNLIHNNEGIKNSLYTTDNNKMILKREDIITKFTNEHEHKLHKEVESRLEPFNFNVTQNGWALFAPEALVQH
ncbi:uncharacterized protein [Pyxicephalus adspersus]|uniref:uncharacterized protein n=1 Tax=Pyxicephalus adspersus TaxID=30357 RepID=UPI003B5C353C